VLNQQHADWDASDTQFSHLRRAARTGNYMGIIEYLLSL